MKLIYSSSLIVFVALALLHYYGLDIKKFTTNVRNITNE